MSEYIIDMGNSSYQSASGLLCADVSQLREEIVRCRDCRYYINSEYFYSPFCSLMNDRDTEPDGFCAWGERRES